jgi:membrane peptidoglycan carboxypeptidase
VSTARTLALAWKYEQAYPKADILDRYVNSVSLGRGAYGVEAAAQAYFGKTANRDADPAAQITMAEAILIASMARQPNAHPTERRWREVQQSMVELGHLTPSEAAGMGFPGVVDYDPNEALSGLDKPTGHIVNHVLAEVAATPPMRGRSWDAIRDGGLTIVSTVDAGAQRLLERAADETEIGSVMFGQPDNLRAASAVVEPGTGRVLAYFGGHRGTGADFAGWYVDSNGDATGYGAHRAGGTFHASVLAAALADGVSLRSRWRTGSRDLPGRAGADRIRDRARCPTGSVCTLADAALVSMDSVHYELTSRLGAGKVIDAAEAAGIGDMWTDEPKRTRLTTGGGAAFVPSPFTDGVGIGQYAVTVLDQANAMATYAGGGTKAQAHFVREVRKAAQVLYAEPAGDSTSGADPGPAVGPALSKPMLADLTWALSRTPAGKLKGIDSATCTGVAPVSKSPEANAHAWIIGFTTDLAMAVWVGNSGEENPIADADGEPVVGSGLPASIYRTFMTAAHAELGLTPGRFAKPAFTGDSGAGSVTG